jgi:hypothetical protein
MSDKDLWEILSLPSRALIMSTKNDFPFFPGHKGTSPFPVSGRVEKASLYTPSIAFGYSYQAILIQVFHKSKTRYTAR